MRLLGFIACLAAVVTSFGFGVYSISLAYSHGDARCIVGSHPDGECLRQIDTDRSGLPFLAESLVSNPEPMATDDLERRDLAAQESMSVWAFWMMVLSAVGIAITAIGTSLLLWQIMLTRKAVAETSDATDAMRLANKISEQNGALQLRAYVGIDAANYHVSVRPNGGAGFAVAVIIKNYGQTPAYKFRQKLGLFKRSVSSPSTPDMTHDGTSHTLFPTMISNARASLVLTASEYALFQSGGLGFYVTIAVEYEDLTGTKRTTVTRYVCHAACGNFQSGEHGATLTFGEGAAD